MSAAAFPLGLPWLAYLWNGWGLVALGGALTAVPILIHLLNRRRVKVVPWAAMGFLLAAIKRNRRRLQLENWLVLALRVAAVALLGLALARPVVTDSSLAGLAGARQTLYLVLDTSGSTGARREARSVLDALKAEAALALEGLEGLDPFCVLATNDPRVEASTGREPAVLVPRTSGSSALTRAKEAVAALPARDAPADWAATYELLGRQLVGEDVGRHVVVVTDLTARDFTQGAARDRAGEALRGLVRRGARVTFVDVGGRADARRNLAVESIEVRGDRPPFPGRAVPLSVRVANHGPEVVRDAVVTVVVEGATGEVWRRRRLAPALAAADPATGKPGLGVIDVDAPASTFRLPGAFHARATIDPPASMPDADALALDSVRWAPLTVRDRLRVLAWTRPSAQSAQAPRALLGASFDPVLPPRPTGGEAAPPVFDYMHADDESAFVARLTGQGTRPDLVVLANTAPRGPTVQAALLRHVKDGGALLVFVGDQVDPRMWNDAFHRVPAEDRLLPLALEPAEVPTRRASDPAPFHLDFATPSEEAWARTFSGPDVALWLGRFPPSVLGRLAFAAPPAPPPVTPADRPGGSAEPAPAPTTAAAGDARVVLRWLEGAGPAVIEGRLGLGRTLWVGTSMDEGWLRLGVPFFLPVFLEEAAFHLTAGDDTPGSVRVGETLEAVLPRGAEGERLRAPGGREPTLRVVNLESEQARRRVACESTGQAGAWLLTAKAGASSGPLSTWYAVNVDPDEGSLLRADPAVLIAAAGPEAPVQVVETLRAMTRATVEAREGELARLLLGIVLGLLVLESLLAFLLGRRGGVEGAAAPGRAT